MNLSAKRLAYIEMFQMREMNCKCSVYVCKYEYDAASWVTGLRKLFGTLNILQPCLDMI